MQDLVSKRFEICTKTCTLKYDKTCTKKRGLGLDLKVSPLCRCCCASSRKFAKNWRMPSTSKQELGAHGIMGLAASDVEMAGATSKCSRLEALERTELMQQLHSCSKACNWEHCVAVSSCVTLELDKQTCRWRFGLPSIRYQSLCTVRLSLGLRVT